MAAARRLSQRYPHVEVLPVCADFTSDFDLPVSCHDGLRRVVYFPGSTIGNFERVAAVELLARMADFCSADGGVLIGIDLQKSPAVIEAAYNDARGVTAQFNLNLLARINRELDADFRLEQFEHLAFYDRQFQRVDLRLVSRCRQTVRIGSEFRPSFSQASQFTRNTRISTRSKVSHNWRAKRDYRCDSFGMMNATFSRSFI